ncbi:MAG: hypothetical protein RI955_960, partial [Bacteroidota bacterium]
MKQQNESGSYHLYAYGGSPTPKSYASAWRQQTQLRVYGMKKTVITFLICVGIIFNSKS